MLRWVRYVAVFVLIAVAGGCGSDRPELAPVHGKVTLDRQPLSGGTIHFWPAQGRPARGTIGPDGTYSLSTFDEKDGAVLGEHVVTIEATRVHGDAPEIKSLEEEMAYYGRKDAPRVGPAAVERLVPEKYSRRETSGLAATVNRGRNPIDFNLTKGP